MRPKYYACLYVCMCARACVRALRACSLVLTLLSCISWNNDTFPQT